MAQTLLRALRHRSTPTLLPSSDQTQSQPAYPATRWDIFVPSIVVTIPSEEGGVHYCAFAGSPFPRVAAATAAAAAADNFRDFRAAFASTSTLAATDTKMDANSVLASARGVSSSSGANHPKEEASLAGFDVPLPDFVALEEAISKLRKQSETPTFRRPGSPMEQQAVVMPKRKSVVVLELEDEREGDQIHTLKRLPSGAKRTSRPRPPRGSFPSPSPTSYAPEDEEEEWEEAFSPTPAPASMNAEVIQVAEEAIMQAMHAAQNPKTPQQRKQGLLRGFTKRKKDPQQQRQQHQQQHHLASVSHESVLNSQPVVVVNSPEDELYDGTHPLTLSRSMIWQSGPSTVGPSQAKMKRNSLNWLFPKKQKQPKRASLPPQPLAERVPVDLQWTTVHAQPNVVSTQAAEYKLPDCFPAIEEGSTENTEFDKEKPLPPIPMSQSQPSEWYEADEHVEMQIRNTPVMGGVVSPVSVFAGELARQAAVPAVVTPISESSQQQQSDNNKERKPKRKFSLKRLREKFLSSPSTPAPPVPPLPTTVDTTKLPPVPILVVTAPMVLPSKSFESVSFFPFETPAIGDIQDVDEDQSVSPRVTMESVSSIPVNNVSLDEDSNLSTSSEDSGSSAVASTASTPDSTPPDTPDSATAEGAIFATQQKQIGVASSIALDDVVETKEVSMGIPRSHGMRMKLDSLHFEELQTGVSVVVA